MWKLGKDFNLPEKDKKIYNCTEVANKRYL